MLEKITIINKFPVKDKSIRVKTRRIMDVSSKRIPPEKKLTNSLIKTINKTTNDKAKPK